MERLQRILSARGIASRRVAEEMQRQVKFDIKKLKAAFEGR